MEDSNLPYKLNPEIPFLHESQRTLKSLEEIYNQKEIQDLLYSEFTIPVIDSNDVAKLSHEVKIHEFLEHYEEILDLRRARKVDNLQDVVVVVKEYDTTEGGRHTFTPNDDYGPFEKYIKK